jgi:hypothetical protein
MNYLHVTVGQGHVSQKHQVFSLSLCLSLTVNAKRRLVNPVSHRWCSSVVAIISSQLACTDGSGVHISVLVGRQSSYLHEQN